MWNTSHKIIKSSKKLLKQKRLESILIEINGTRKEDKEIINLLENINHWPTHNCVQAERNVLKVLDGDCETAVGAIANLENQNINLEAELFSIDGKQRFYHKASKNINYSSELGREVGEILKKESNNSYKR